MINASRFSSIFVSFWFRVCSSSARISFVRSLAGASTTAAAMSRQTTRNKLELVSLSVQSIRVYYLFMNHALFRRNLRIQYVRCGDTKSIWNHLKMKKKTGKWHVTHIQMDGEFVISFAKARAVNERSYLRIVYWWLLWQRILIFLHLWRVTAIR